MKNNVKILICLILMLCSILFVSCNQSNEPDTQEPDAQTTPQQTTAGEPTQNEEEVTQSRFSGYSVIYAQSELNSLKATVSECLAGDIGNIAFSSDEAAAAEKEILVGETNRSESASAKALLDGSGFVISVINNKIAVVGSDDIQTIRAVNYFTEKYLDTNTKISPSESVVVKADAPNVSLSDAYTFVFSSKLDDTAGNIFESTSKRDARDYPCVAADDLITYMEIVPANRKRATDDNVTELEVLIGEVDREAYSDFAVTLAENEYGILVKGGKVILAGHNNLAIEKCVSSFKELLDLAKNESTWAFYEGFSIKGIANSDWVIDFTRPSGEGISLYNTMDCNDDSLQFLYTGTGVNAAAFDTYCAQLISEGYTVLIDNTVENSKFKTLVNNDKGITLHVAYNDFKYESDYVVDDKYSVDYEKCIRIISAPTSSVDLPTADMVTENRSYTKVANSTLTALGLDHNAVGMSYVIRLEDGSFIIFDGGYYSSGIEHVILWKILENLHTEAYGSAPSEENPIRISAWVITHSHADHFRVFKSFIAKYGSDPLLDLEALVGNFPANNVLWPTGGANGGISTLGAEGAIAEFQGQVLGGFKYIKVHGGQRLHFANVSAEVLMTYEDHNPIGIQEENDTCTILRLSINTTDAQKGSVTSAASAVNTTTAVFLADAQRYQSRYLCAMYGSYLSSDIVQLAHHGNNGCEIPLYDAIQASVVLWPECNTHVPMYMNPQNLQKGFHYEVDQHVVNMSTVKYIIASHKDYFTTFDFTEDGPDYDNIYDARTDKALEYDGVMFIKK